MKGSIISSTVRSSSGVAENFIRTTDIRNKILTFRDLLDLSPCISSATANELLTWTLKDLHRLYPSTMSSISISEIECAAMQKVLLCFCDALKILGDSWTNNSEWMVKCRSDSSSKLGQDELEQLAQAMLEDMNKLARERMFDMMDEDERISDDGSSENAFGRTYSGSYSESKTSLSSSPATPTSVLPDIGNMLSKGTKLSYSPPLLFQLRVQAVEKLNPIDVKRLSFHMLSHAVANENTVPDQKSETVVNLPTDVKCESEAKADVTNEVSQDFQMEEDTMDISMSPDGSPKTAGGTWTGKANSESGPFARAPKEMDIDVVPPPLSLPKLRSHVSEKENPPPPATEHSQWKLYPNEPESQASAPPTPPLHKLSPQEVVSALQPLTAASEPLQSLPIPPPPPPPLPPVPQILGENTVVKTPPPPPPMASNTALFPPPPPRPPPMASSSALFPPPSPPPPPMASSSALFPPPSPPPPPMASSTALFPLPPPPPPSLISGHRSPPPPPSLPSSGNVKLPPPPPPPMAFGKGTPPPPPPPMGAASGGLRAPPPPVPPGARGSPPPPPGPGGARNLHVRKAATKLKRSAQMGNLYRLLKGKVEGGTDIKTSRKGGKISNPTGGKQGMADALAEMTKRSAYFQQIEEDFKTYGKSIRELKTLINSFQSSSMDELDKFHKHVESILEKLTDESQMFARVEDFPTKKLEAVRMAAALYSKLDNIIKTLKNWQIESPVGQVIDKLENYFTKVKQELDALERTKDEETKKFKNHKITFDFGILVQIKELMVDVSSSCMELALRERREAMAAASADPKTERQKKGSAKMLWKAFQFAYRIYTFAGGHDDRADQLTREIANEIQTDPNH